MNILASLFKHQILGSDSLPDHIAQENLFGRSKTPAEQLRAHQRSLQKAQRELDRERTKLEGQEKKLGVLNCL